MLELNVITKRSDYDQISQVVPFRVAQNWLWCCQIKQKWIYFKKNKILKSHVTRDNPYVKIQKCKDKKKAHTQRYIYI